MALDIKVEMNKLRAMYKDTGQNTTFNALIYGSMGTGKTNLLRTCRKPVLIASFDPGGSKTVRDEIDKGSIVVDNRFEFEDPMKPTVFALWDEVYHTYKREGLFPSIGTYVIDSATTWSAAAMNVTLRKAGRAGSQPFQQDYLPTMVILENAIKDLTTLPCDIILIAHDTADKDEATGKIFISPDFIGKLKTRIPLLFDEIYYAHTKETSNGIKYSLLTQSTGLIKARSRLASGGKLQTYEDQDIKAILKKAGFSTEDKE